MQFRNFIIGGAAEKGRVERALLEQERLSGYAEYSAGSLSTQREGRDQLSPRPYHLRRALIGGRDRHLTAPLG